MFPLASAGLGDIGRNREYSGCSAPSTRFSKAHIPLDLRQGLSGLGIFGLTGSNAV
jgi:hypothetical protein